MMKLQKVQTKISLYWIGTRESEIVDTENFFKGSITIFGSNKNSNYSFDKTYCWRFNYNFDNDKFIEFVNNTACMILNHDSSAKFMFCLPDEVQEYCDEIQKNCICQNEMDLLELLGNKIYCKLWLNNSIQELPYITMTGKELLTSNLKLYFDEYDEFVIQSAFSCGGFGTKLFNPNDITINPNILYMITPYIKKNISLNIHVIVYNNDIVLLPPSIQIITLIDNMFLYKGADFVAYKRLPLKIQHEIHTMTKIISRKLQHCGYLGVCGIDFLYDIDKDRLYYSEINARFQSSTFILNKALTEYGISVQKLHFESFNKEFCEWKNMIPQYAPYSFYGYQYLQKMDMQLRYLHSKLINNKNEFYDDQLDWDHQLDDYTYLFKVVFHHSIVSWETDNIIRLPENISLNYIEFEKQKERSEYFINLKIALINQGISVSDSVLKYIEKYGKMNYEEFEALDIRLVQGLHFNVPFQVKLSELSPFTVEMFSNNTYVLCYYNSPMQYNNQLLEISIRTQDPLACQLTKHGFGYDEISYLGIDRLRIYHKQGCYFKSIGQECKFCDIENVPSSFTIEDIKEVLEAYKSNSHIKHFLIGGGSEIPESDFSNIIALTRYIKKTFNKPIYLMTLPPKSTDILDALQEAGITEMAFNIEIFDREIAKQIMPGKGKIPIGQYLKALEYSVKIFGKNGAVRSIFILGLEPRESLLNGIEEVCKRGISPILSLFRPISGTALEDRVPFTNREIKEIYDQILVICQKYGVKLGPQCHYCEDNTLKISFL